MAIRRAYGYFGNGCPPGFGAGLWGHCRDTPYHGRLPGAAALGNAYFAFPILSAQDRAAS